MKIEAGKIYRARAGHKVRVSPKQDDASYITCLHEPEDLQHNQASGPIRTEKKRTLVPGTYGDLILGPEAFSLCHTPLSEICAAIALLTEIAEVYEENQK